MYSSVLPALLLTVSCTTAGSPSRNNGLMPEAAPFVTQGQALDRVLTHRRQANALRELAQRMEWEARWYGRQSGLGRDESSRRLIQAKELLAAAEDADEQARALQRHIPHGQVQ